MANEEKYDFSGYVTKNDIVCSDGRRIRQNAFEHQNGEEVPLVWNHQRNDPNNIIGKVRLENRPDGVYGYGTFNTTEKGQTTKALVEQGNIKHMSIFANQLMEKAKNVMHGQIREVSLVLAGANPGAVIDNVSIVHSDGSIEDVEGEAIIYTDEELEWNEEEDEPEVEHADSPTFRDVYNSLTDDQKVLMYAMVQHALDSKDDDEAEHADDDINEENGGIEMKKNVFEGTDPQGPSLSHSDIQQIFEDARRYEPNSLAKFVTQACLEHGITNIEYLFDEEQLIRQRPDIISRDMAWVSKVFDAASKSPFSRIKSMAANLTADEARARGYIKGKKKLDEQFALLKRSTTPQTVYKKQSFDRDDIIDISSFEVIAWVKAEMKMMWREEIARAQLVGDGRNASSDDKISETNIRPIFGDAETYVIYKKVTLPADGNYTDTANALIDALAFARKDYKGSGTPTMFTTSDMSVNLTLAKDKNGRRLYNTANEIASALRVSEVVDVPVMENVVKDSKKLLAIVVNMKDYTLGATKMGQLTTFEDFDIDYNKQKYLIEGRMSGALTLPYSAIVLYADVSSGSNGSGSNGSGSNDDDDDTSIEGEG